MAGVGALIMMFVAIIVGVVLLQSSAQNIGSSTNTVAVNQSISTVVNGTAQYLTNIKSLASPVVYNETGGVVIGAGNYTITNNVVYNGQESVRIVPDTAAAWKTAWIVTGTGQPLGYVPESGSRTIVGLIVLFAALAIAIVVLGPSLKEITGVGM